MRKAESVANYIIAYALKIGHPISNLQLQKILYYIQVHFLKNTGVPFFKDDIVAWLIGPVIPNVYYQYAVFGPAPITIFNETDMDFDSKEQKELNQIIRDKSVLSPWDMLRDICQEGKPWQLYYEPDARNVIPKKAMELYG